LIEATLSSNIELIEATFSRSIYAYSVHYALYLKYANNAQNTGYVSQNPEKCARKLSR